jgi:prolyl-tRNA editing enzyme YbaK/EbsC (Cys-tRNA(Pro) deacylase)
VTAWPPLVEKVAQAMREARVEGRVEEFAEETRTADAAADAIGCEPAQIVKSLVFSCDGTAVLVLVPGDRRADTDKVARLLGCARVRSVPAAEVEGTTGFPAGGVAPFPVPIETVLADLTLLTHPVVWIGAGSPRHMASLAPADLMRLARARTVDAVVE